MHLLTNTARPPREKEHAEPTIAESLATAAPVVRCGALVVVGSHKGEAVAPPSTKEGMPHASGNLSKVSCPSGFTWLCMLARRKHAHEASAVMKSERETSTLRWLCFAAMQHKPDERSRVSRPRTPPRCTAAGLIQLLLVANLPAFCAASAPPPPLSAL